MSGWAGWLAPIYFAGALPVLLLPGPRPRALGGIGLALLGLAAASEAVGDPGASGFFTGVNELLALAGGLLVVAAGVVGWRGRRNQALSGAAAPPPLVGYPGLDPLLLAGLTLASAGPHLLVVGAGALLALTAGARGAIRAGRASWLVLLVLSAGSLSVALGLTSIILGPAGGEIRGLAEGPFSPAAERLLVMLLGGAGLLVAGLPPLHAAPWRLALSPVAAIVLVRVVGPAFPGGLVEWQAFAMLLLLVALALAASLGRWSGVAAAAGLATLWSGRTEGILPGCGLVLWAWLSDLLAVVGQGRGFGLRLRWAGIAGLVPVAAALPALIALLRAQVLLPVLGVAAVGAGLGLELGRRSRPS